MTDDARGIRWMFHATALGASYEDLLEPLARLFGCRVLHDTVNDAPGINRRGGMTWLGDNALEVGAPLGADSPAAQFVERFGGGMHSIAVQVHDVAATMARLVPLGVEVGTRISPEIVFTRPSSTAGLLFEWASHVQHDDPRWGAPEPAFVAPPVVTIAAMAYVAAVVQDPVADGERLAAVLDTDLTTSDDGVVLALGDCSLLLEPLGDESRPRCVALGLVVDDLGEAERALLEAQVKPITAAGYLLLGPPDLPFPVRLVDRLLVGDPRRSSATPSRVM